MVMDTIIGASKRRPFSDHVLEPIRKRSRTVTVADPLEFNDPDTIRDFLIEQNLPLYPDIIYLSDSDTDTDEDQDTGEDSIRPWFFADETESVTEEADLRETTDGDSGDRSLTESASLRVFRPVLSFSDYSDVSDGSVYDSDGEGSCDSAVTSVQRISDERPEEIVEGEGDNFVMEYDGEGSCDSAVTSVRCFSDERPEEEIVEGEGDNFVMVDWMEYACPALN